MFFLLADIRTAPYRPFLDPLWGAWSDGVWPLLLLPLCVAVAIVYKSIKCRSMSDVPRPGGGASRSGSSWAWSPPARCWSPS